MSRYEAAIDGWEPIPYEQEGLWEHRRQRAIRGKRGQRTLRDLREYLKAGPHRLAFDMLADEEVGAGCAVGEYIIMSRVQKGEAREAVISALHGAAEDDPDETALRGVDAGLTWTLAVEMEFANDGRENDTPEERYDRFMAWLDEVIDD